MIGQRLVRRLCERCKKPATLDSATLERVKTVLGPLLPADGTFWSAPGCDTCNAIGYKGRIGIYEIFTMNKSIEDMILANKVSEYTIQDIATQNGMVTMAQDGLLKALDKITTVEEVFRVTE